MTRYVDLDTIHEPTGNAYVPAAWGHQIRQNFDSFQRPAHFTGERVYSDANQANIASGSLTEVDWNLVVHHSGDFYPEGDATATTFIAPDDGFYLAHCYMAFEGVDATPPSATTQVYVALMEKNDATTGNFLLRSSTHLSTTSASLGGATYMRAGTNFTFVAYQDTGTEATFYGKCSVLFIGGTP